MNGGGQRTGHCSIDFLIAERSAVACTEDIVTWPLKYLISYCTKVML